MNGVSQLLSRKSLRRLGSNREVENRITPVLAVWMVIRTAFFRIRWSKIGLNDAFSNHCPILRHNLKNHRWRVRRQLSERLSKDCAFEPDPDCRSAPRLIHSL
jgi:hypothetical protein